MIARACAHTRHVPGANLNGDAVEDCLLGGLVQMPANRPVLDSGELEGVQPGTGGTWRWTAGGVARSWNSRAVHTSRHDSWGFSEWSQPIHLDNPVPQIAGRLPAVL